MQGCRGLCGVVLESEDELRGQKICRPKKLTKSLYG